MGFSAAVKTKRYEAIRKGQVDDISLKLDSGKRRQVTENSERLKSVIATIIFSCCQETASKSPQHSGRLKLVDVNVNCRDYCSTHSKVRVVLYYSTDVQNEITDIRIDIVAEIT